ncbi:hypothetical protein F5B20DRAFT_315266 [Whalleya microplaca]|nr:hypothetical protein F5B20DRAFT_315266 [Whalleya microplaca]
MVSWSIASVLVLSLFGNAFASPVDIGRRASSTIIGYRSVTQQQAQNYKDAGNTLTPDPNLIGTQIGTGVYTTPGPGQWPGGGWYCVILADVDRLNAVSKAWVPKTYNGQQLWNQGDTVINNYIKALDASWNPAKTFRMSKIDGKEEILQMVIPFDLLNQNGGAMNIKTQCSSNLADMGTYVVNYDEWKNVKGSK